MVLFKYHTSIEMSVNTCITAVECIIIVLNCANCFKGQTLVDSLCVKTLFLYLFLNRPCRCLRSTQLIKMMRKYEASANVTVLLKLDRFSVLVFV